MGYWHRDARIMKIPTKDLRRWHGDENNSAANVARLVQRGIWDDSDCAKLGVEMAEPFVAPDGFMITGNERFERRDGEIRQVFDVEPVPADPVPDVVSRRQFLMQLHISGLTELVEGWVAQQDGLIKIAYENSSTFHRNEPMMLAGFAALGFTEEQIDEFYSNAAGL